VEPESDADYCSLDNLQEGDYDPRFDELNDVGCSTVTI